MKMVEVRQKAKAIGVKAKGSKAQVIQQIQKAEGNTPCFGTRDVCGQMDCCWREDCLPEAAR